MNAPIKQSADVPERLSEQEARAIIEANGPRFNNLKDRIVAIRTRAEEARRQSNELLDQAEAKLGVRDEAKIAQILDDRKLLNGQRAKEWLKGIESVEQEIANVQRSVAPGR